MAGGSEGGDEGPPLLPASSLETPEMMSVLRLVGVFLAARPLGSVSCRMAVSATGSRPLERLLSRLLLATVPPGLLLLLSTVVVFSVTSTDFAICSGPGLDSGDCGDNGAIRHDGPVQLDLLGWGDTGAWCGGSGGAQVSG